MTSANDDQPPPRPRMVPLIGTLHLDTGVYEPARVVELLPESLLRALAIAPD